MISIASMVGAPDLETPTLAPYSGDFEEAFRKLHELGYEGVEIMTRRPDRLDSAELRHLLDLYQLRLAGLCTGHVFGEEKLGLVTPQLKINEQAVQRLKIFIDFAARFEPGRPVNIGRTRGAGDPARLQDTFDCAREAMQELADYAKPAGVRLILEPINRGEVNFIHSTKDGLELVKRVNRPNFGLMLDTYHMALEDADPFSSLQEAAPYVWHIHFSDTNRRWPGNVGSLGSFSFDRFIRALEDIGYDGFVGTEIQPWPDPDGAARLSIEYLRKYIPAPRTRGESYGP